MDTPDPATHGPTGDPEERSPPDLFVAALLRNPVRARIMELLELRPGMNKHQLATSIGVHINAVHFHVDRLAKVGLVEPRPGWKGRETLCFTAENVDLWENPATRVLFGRGPPRQVAEYLAEHPGAGAQEASEALGLSVHTVRRHLRTLEECALVQRLRVDRRVIYHAEPDLMDWLQDVGRRYEQEGLDPQVKA